MSVYFQVTGIADVLSALDALKESARSALIAKAVGKCLRPVKKKAKQLAPRSNPRAEPNLKRGLLAKSIQVKVRVYRSEGRALGVVGPARGYARDAGVRKYGRKQGEVWRQNPVHYAHLVENGAAGRRGKCPAQPFLRPALDSCIGSFERIFREEIEAALEKLARTGRLQEKLTGVASEHWVGNVEDL